jgi:superfamily II DNA or RNA helicase
MRGTRMVPKTLVMIPMMVRVADPRPLLAMPLDDFLSSGFMSSAERKAATAVAQDRGALTVGAFCDAEVDALLCSRFSPRVAESIRSHLCDWLQTCVAELDDLDELDETEDPAEVSGDGRGAASTPRPESSPRPTLPAIEAPPVTVSGLYDWADRHGVRERLGDRIKTDMLLRSYYGLGRESLPQTVGEAALITSKQIRGPAYVRASVASELVSFAKEYLHRAAQAVAMAGRSDEERAGRARPPEDPLLRRLFELVRRQRDALAVDQEPRPAGTYLPGRIVLEPSQLALAYFEWSLRDNCTPGSPDRSVFRIVLSGWDAGELQLQCLLCRDLAECPHRVTALDRLLAAIEDPSDPLAETLPPVLRVPSWSRMLDYLDQHLVRTAPAETEKQRLIWELSGNPGNRALQPVLQKMGKRGAWSRGQRVRLNDLEYRQHLLLDAVDKAAVEAILGARDSAYYYSDAVQTPRQVYRGLETLVGSNRVFADSSRSVPISVRKVRPGLKVVPVDSGYRLRALLGPSEVDARVLLDSAPDKRHVVWLEAEHNRCLITTLDPNMITLLTAMAQHPAILPTDVVGELLDRLHRMQARLDLHLPESVRGECVEPPSTVVCRLEPLPDAGLSVCMVVRPIAGGPTFVPGEGTPEVLHARDGHRVHAVRQLAGERERAAHVAQILGLDDTSSTGDFRWEVSDDEAALALLGKVRDVADLVEVEWPAGDIRVDSVGRAALKVAVRKRRDWFGAEGGVEIEGAKVALSELLAAIRAGRRFVKLDSRRFATIEDDLRERLAALDDVVFDNQGTIELGVLAAPVLADLVVDRDQLDLVPAFRTVLGKLEAASTIEVARPEGLTADLRHYQGDGFGWLVRLSSWGLGACLADDMGLGKTVQAIALLLQRAEVGPALVIAPTSVVANWIAEMAKFAPGLAAHIYRGPERAALLPTLGKGSVLVTSYAIAVRDAEALQGIAFGTLIVDEAQAVKNALTQRFRAIRDLQAEFRVALTGTPIENHLGELWAIFRLVTPGLLGSWEQFRQRFAMPIERHHDRARQTALARVVRPFLLRRTKAEVAPELPARTEMNQSIELGPVERRLYEAARLEVLESLGKSAAAGVGDEARQRIKILAALTRLRLLCCHPRLVVKDSSAGSAKLAALVDLLLELRDEGHRVLVFSQFTSFLDLARPLLVDANLCTLTLDGSTPADERDERVRAFQAGEADVFLLSLRAGGTGLNLTAATYVIHLDPWWNPAVEDQATDRAHRIGQERPVTVIRLVARGTIEEEVLALHEEKRQLAASILDGADVAGHLGTDDLLDLIRRSGSSAEEDADEGDAPVEATAGEGT